MNKELLVLDAVIVMSAIVVLILGTLAGLQFVCKLAGSILLGRRVS
jgi:hypothetical protein